MYKKEVIKDAIDKKMLETEETKMGIIRSMIIYLLAFIGYVVFSPSNRMMINGEIDWIIALVFELGGFFLLGVLATIPFLKLITYGTMSKLNPYVRTKTGKALNEKLEGLTKYIKDFSLMEEKEKSDMILWEEYLIYSVMFGINEKIVEEYKEKLN